MRADTFNTSEEMAKLGLFLCEGYTALKNTPDWFCKWLRAAHAGYT
jgi:hypothetical protein